MFLRAWVQVDLPKFYNPVYGYGKTKLLKTHWELRDERGIEIDFKPDSVYISREEELKLNEVRSERVTIPLHVPKSLVEALPFNS